MIDRDCLCTGIKLARKVVEHTDNPALPGTLKAAQAIYNHLQEQVNKPQHQALKEKLNKDFEDMRTDLMTDKYTDHPGVLAMERIRDKIHKSTDLKSLLVCGDSFEDKAELDQVTALVSKVWEIMAESDDTAEAFGPLDDLAKHYGCE